MGQDRNPRALDYQLRLHRGSRPLKISYPALTEYRRRVSEQQYTQFVRGIILIYIRKMS